MIPPIQQLLTIRACGKLATWLSIGVFVVEVSVVISIEIAIFAVKGADRVRKAVDPEGHLARYVGSLIGKEW